MALKMLSINEKLKAFDGFVVVDKTDLDVLVTAARWTARTYNLEDFYKEKDLKGQTKESIKKAIKNVTSGLKTVKARFVGFDEGGK